MHTVSFDHLTLTWFVCLFVSVFLYIPINARSSSPFYNPFLCGLWSFRINLNTPNGGLLGRDPGKASLERG